MGLRRPPWSLTRQLVDGLLNVDPLSFDVLQIEGARNNELVLDLNTVTPRTSNGDPSVRVPSQTHSDQMLSPSSTDLRAAARKSGTGEHGLPVGVHLRSPHKHATWMCGLFAAVVLVEQGRGRIEVVCIDSNQ